MAHVAVAADSGSSSVDSSESTEHFSPPSFTPRYRYWIRYATTQRNSSSGDAWRSVTYERDGILRETGYFREGRGRDGEESGFWALHQGVRKFFLYSRLTQWAPLGE